MGLGGLWGGCDVERASLGSLGTSCGLYGLPGSRVTPVRILWPNLIPPPVQGLFSEAVEPRAAGGAYVALHA